MTNNSENTTGIILNLEGETEEEHFYSTQFERLYKIHLLEKAIAKLED
jgi:hypothetical protein